MTSEEIGRAREAMEAGKKAMKLTEAHPLAKIGPGYALMSAVKLQQLVLEALINDAEARNDSQK